MEEIVIVILAFTCLYYAVKNRILRMIIEVKDETIKTLQDTIEIKKKQVNTLKGIVNIYEEKIKAAKN